MCKESQSSLWVSSSLHRAEVEHRVGEDEGPEDMQNNAGTRWQRTRISAIKSECYGGTKQEFWAREYASQILFSLCWKHGELVEKKWKARPRVKTSAVILRAQTKIRMVGMEQRKAKRIPLHMWERIAVGDFQVFPWLCDWMVTLVAVERVQMKQLWG